MGIPICTVTRFPALDVTCLLWRVCFKSFAAPGATVLGNWVHFYPLLSSGKGMGIGVGGSCGCACIAFGKPLHLKMLFRTLSRGMKGNVKRTLSYGVPRMMVGTNGTKRNDLMAAAFPPMSEERLRAVQALGKAIHTQFHRIHVIPASSILYCTIFLQCFSDSENGRRVTMNEVLGSLSKLQFLLGQVGALFMRFDTTNRRTTVHRIRGFTERFSNWIDLRDAPSPRDRGGFAVLPNRESSVVYYIRSNHILGKLAPSCIIVSAVVACLNGFGQRVDKEGHATTSHRAPRQSDFISAPCVERGHVIGAAMWLREILSPEIDAIVGEDGFRTQADMQDCLDRLLSDGVLTNCIAPADQGITRPSSASSGASGAASGTQGSQRRSVDRVVDKLIFGVMEETGRASMQFESDLKKCRDIPNYHRMKRDNLSTLLPLLPSPPEADENSLLDEDKEVPPNSSYIGFTEDSQGGHDFYSFLYGPILATYAHLFQELMILFRKKTEYEDKTLVKELMTGLRDIWDSPTPPQNLIRAHIPCLTIVQRFVAYLKHPRTLNDDMAFSPYPMLVVQCSQSATPSRPPRPSLSGDSKLRRESSNSNLASVTSLPGLLEDAMAAPLLHIRREFRDGALEEYPTKLLSFLTRSRDNLF